VTARDTFFVLLSLFLNCYIISCILKFKKKLINDVTYILVKSTALCVAGSNDDNDVLLEVTQSDSCPMEASPQLPLFGIIFK